jgi:hypothetical protein
MTFTYDASLSDNVSLVRFHIGDNKVEGHYLEDEEIQHFITAGSVGSAVVVCIKYIISQLSQPDFKKDWLSVSREAAREGYEKLLKNKSQEFGISLSNLTATATISQPYRSDSYQDSDESTYDGSP